MKVFEKKSRTVTRVATWSGKTKKKDKSQEKMGVFEKGKEI